MGPVWPKISGTRGRPPPTILLVRKLDEWIFYTVYKNFGKRLFRFVTMHAFDRQTDRQTERRQQVAFAVAR